MGSAASVERPPFISKDEAKGMVRYEGRKWDEAMDQQFDQNVGTDGDSAGKVDTVQAVELYEKYKRETPPPAQPSPKSPSKRKYRDNMRSWVASVRTLDPRQQLAEFLAGRQPWATRLPSQSQSRGGGRSVVLFAIFVLPALMLCE